MGTAGARAAVFDTVFPSGNVISPIKRLLSLPEQKAKLLKPVKLKVLFKKGTFYALSLYLTWQQTVVIFQMKHRKLQSK